MRCDESPDIRCFIEVKMFDERNQYLYPIGKPKDSSCVEFLFHKTIHFA